MSFIVLNDGPGREPVELAPPPQSVNTFSEVVVPAQNDKRPPVESYLAALSTNPDVASVNAVNIVRPTYQAGVTEFEALLPQGAPEAEKKSDPKVTILFLLVGYLIFKGLKK